MRAGRFGLSRTCTRAVDANRLPARLAAAQSPLFHHPFTVPNPTRPKTGGHCPHMRFAIVAHRAGETNIGLIARP
jgi:hypothetical protein